jgi:dihydroorotate dehydrogenase
MGLRKAASLSGLHDLAARALRGLDPEDAHRLTIRLLGAGLGPRRRAEVEAADLAVDLCGLKLDACIGLAAGFDKNAEVPDAMLAAGFGFVECGSVTPKPQAGNPRPRLFRLSADQAVINRMGFNNDGLEVVAARLGRRKRAGVVGANIGANKDSEDRAGDYAVGLERLWTLADYFVLNISSPNTPGLRALQGAEALDDLLGRVAAKRAALAAASGDHPIFLKIAPDLEPDEIVAIVEAAVAHGIDAMVVGNTTIARPPELTSPHRDQTGGLSGAPLMAPSTGVLRHAYAAARGRLALIGCGGVASGADAYAKILAGARAVQLYSAMVYEGPGLVGRVRRDLATLLAADGYASVAEAVGADNPLGAG